MEQEVEQVEVDASIVRAITLDLNPPPKPRYRRKDRKFKGYRRKRGRPKKRKSVHRKDGPDPFRFKSPEERLRIRAAAAERMKKIRLLRGTRAGIPDGMRKPEAMRLWALAREKANWLMAELEKAKVVIFNPDIPEDQMARQALVEAMAMAMAPGRDQMKMAAIRTVLEYTKSKPATKTDLKVSTAEQWLEEVVHDHRASLPAPADDAIIVDEVRGPETVSN